MTVVVSFIRPRVSGVASGVGSVRKRENVAVGGTTTTTAESGEIVIIGNGETSMVAVAFGSAPDAAVNGVPVAAGGVSYPLFLNSGDKINVKAVT